MQAALAGNATTADLPVSLLGHVRASFGWCRHIRASVMMSYESCVAV